MPPRRGEVLRKARERGVYANEIVKKGLKNGEGNECYVLLTVR